MTGQVVGRLTVVQRAPANPTRFGRLAAWICRCECGRETTVTGKNLRNGNTRSCGCQVAEAARRRLTKHGHAPLRNSSREYRSWCAAKTRCYNIRQRSYTDYGGRGITMCDEWRADFRAFLRDMGPCPKGHSIERIDHDGNYEPGNCRWATTREQANNTRANHPITFGGETHTVAEWERLRGFRPGSLKRRLLLGWTAERALTAPLRVR